MTLPAEAPLPAVNQTPPRLERMARDTAMVQAFLLLVLFASAVLPWSNRRNVFEEVKRDLGAQAIAAMHFGMPLIAGAITFARLLRGRVPQKPSFWMIASLEIIKAVVAVLAAASVLFRSHSRTDGAVALFGALVLATLIFIAIRRGAAREGWLRWSHLMAAMVPWHLLVAGLLYAELRSGRPPPGLWLYLAAATALLPVSIWAVWPHRASQP